MAKILLVDSGAEDTKRLLPWLKLHGYSVTEYTDGADGLSRLDKKLADFDVVLVDMSRNRREDWKMLDMLYTFRIASPISPAIICTSRAYRRRLRMEVKRRGGRLVIYGR